MKVVTKVKAGMALEMGQFFDSHLFAHANDFQSRDHGSSTCSASICWSNENVYYIAKVEYGIPFCKPHSTFCGNEEKVFEGPTQRALSLRICL